MLTVIGIKKKLIRGAVLTLFALALSFSRSVLAVEYIYNHKEQEQQLSEFNLRAIFTSRMRRWPDGTPVKLVTYNYDNSVFINVCSKMKIYPINFKRVWDMVVYSGGGDGPIFVENKEEMLKVVKTTPGAIGYLETVEKGDEINVLRID